MYSELTSHHLQRKSWVRLTYDMLTYYCLLIASLQSLYSIPIYTMPLIHQYFCPSSVSLSVCLPVHPCLSLYIHSILTSFFSYYCYICCLISSGTACCHVLQSQYQKEFTLEFSRDRKSMSVFVSPNKPTRSAGGAKMFCKVIVI